MFRGGPVSSYGNGIATGLADGGRVGYNVGGPIYPAGYSAVPKGSMTGAEIKEMATRNNYAIIFDVAGQSNILYSDPKYDKSEELIRKLK